MKFIKCLQIWLLLPVSAAAIFLAGFALEDLRFKRINDALNKYTYLFPQQKVYLHIDKKVYRGGDDLWIKAYLLNGLDHLPDTFSTNLYVEIMSPGQTRVQIKRLQILNGFGIGDFHLSDTLPEGLYQIRAFTAWMKNFDADFYFKRNFQVMNPGYTKLISPKQARVNKKTLSKMSDTEHNDVDLQFMPEGGYLVSGLESVVGFKAVNKRGKGVDIEGEIRDNKGKKVTEFKTFYKGIGTFRLTPVKGLKYYAVAKTDNKVIKIPLPEPLDFGVVMHTENTPDQVVVHFASNRHSSDPAANDLIVVGQIGGRIYYSKIVRLDQGKAVLEMPRNIFPSGIMQITAFSGRGTPLAERLVFINMLGSMKINCTIVDSASENGNKVLVKFLVTDRTNKPLPANLSMAVLKENDDETEVNRDNIVSNLLLVSDLKGYIEDPLDYFASNGENNEIKLDNLMLTQGWRRFEWKDVLAGEYPEIKYKEEKGITVSGRITRDFFNLPLERCKVQLSIMDQYNDVFTKYSGENGVFEFDGMVYFDTISVKIEAWRPSGRRNLVIQLPEYEEDKVVGHQGDYTLTTYSDRDKKEHRKKMYAENLKLYKKEKAEEEEQRKNSVQGLYGEPDFVLYNKDFHMVNGNILDVMKGRVPGVMITGNNVVIRGLNTLFGSSQPLYLVDGVPVMDVNAVTSIPLQDIERVEVLKGPKTSFYGARGANGVIAVYTKRGEFLIRGKIEFDMLGYNTPRVFYQPKYEPGKEPPNNYTIAWIPVIRTDSNGRGKAEFDKPAIKGKYRFDIQGVSYSGHAGFSETVIDAE
jgi:TonB-dependent SusC/RagA subfamily outer membrane receptor